MPAPKKPNAKNEQPLTAHQQLGERLKAIRRSKGFKSSESFALANNINRTQYSGYERGAGDIQYSTLMKIIAGLGVSLQEFFGEGFD